jgi:hypothetical protein
MCEYLEKMKSAPFLGPKLKQEPPVLLAGRADAEDAVAGDACAGAYGRNAVTSTRLHAVNGSVEHL